MKNLSSVCMYSNLWRFKVSLDFRSLIQQKPGIWEMWRKLRGKETSYHYLNDIDLLIEGYPRSGTSFAAAAIILSQPKPLFITPHQKHDPNQVIKATQLRMPTLVLIREPKDCVISWCIFDPRLTLSLALKVYTRYYSTVKPYRDSFIVATFGEVTSNFGSIMDRINHKYNTRLTVFEHNDENISKCFDMLDQWSLNQQFNSDRPQEMVVSRPSKDRKKIKEEYVKKFDEQLNSKRFRQLVTRAENTYVWYENSQDKFNDN